MDTISKSRRSWNMSRIRGKDTSPEIAVRSTLHRLGFRFRLHVRDLPGRPDIVLPRFRTVVFVHGCFWHRHKRCRFAYTPKSRTAFWTAKFAENVARDIVSKKALESMGWRVLIVWECQVKEPPCLPKSIVRSLERLRHVDTDQTRPATS